MPASAQVPTPFLSESERKLVLGPWSGPAFDPVLVRDELLHERFEATVDHHGLAVAVSLGTPLVPWFFRLMGARIGRGVCMETICLTEYDLITIGEDACFGADATLQTHLFEDRVMKMSTVEVGARCSVGTDSVVLYDTRMEAGAVLGDLSLLMKGETLPAGTRWQGSPASLLN